LLKATGWVSNESARKVVMERFPGEAGKKNVELMARAQEEVREY
jgi:Pyruvate/2-oxoacid:ferredoxin oxidoreductase gamma subunit